MSVSIAGSLILVALLVLGWRLGSPLLVGLFASLPFGATAIGTFGSATPLIFSIFEVLLVAFFLGQLRYFRRLMSLFATSGMAWIALALLIYVLAGATIFPRLFAGQIPVVGVGVPGLVPIQPVSGNFNQGMNFGFGLAIFFVIRLILEDVRNFQVIFLGLLVGAGIHATLGMVDLGAKLIGIRDILEPIRTSAAVMHTGSSVGSFWRIAGGCSEASQYAGFGIFFLTLTLTYWRATGSRPALIAGLILLVLLALSTSATAYVAMIVIALPMFASIFIDFGADRLRRRDAIILGVIAFGSISMAVLSLTMPSALSGFSEILDMLLNKGSSDSAIERGSWNTSSINAFFLSNGLGIGVGSSRASSWPVAALSQIGILGSMLLSIIVLAVVVGMPGQTKGVAISIEMREIVCMANSVRAAALAYLVAGSLASGTADPGAIFFASAAFVLAARQHCSVRSRVVKSEESYETARRAEATSMR